MADKLAYSVEETAELLSIGKHTAYDLVKAKEISFVNVRKRIIIPHWAIEKFLSDNAVKTEVSA